MAPQQEACLHILRKGSEFIEIQRAPFSQSGRFISIDGEKVEMSVGRTTIRFLASDFADLADTLDDALRLFKDAVDYRDFVEIHVSRKGLSYINEAQYDRIFCALGEEKNTTMDVE